MNLLDPRDGGLKVVNLGQGAAPHGVVIGPDGAAWVTEGGQNAIARVDPKDHKVQLWKLNGGPSLRQPQHAGVRQAGHALVHRPGRRRSAASSPKTEKMQVWDAPRGHGPYGIALTPQGDGLVRVAGRQLISPRSTARRGTPRIVEPPTPQQGARRVWSDSQGRLWISEWNSGNVSHARPAKNGSWKKWKLPGERPRCYSVYVDDRDAVWLTDFAANAIVRFDPKTETFLSFPSDKSGANVRQMAGRPGEAWAGESGTNRLVVIDKPQA